ncbi:hypothetical protein C0992_004912, partial [Termitomyces sp. T32_za158]
APLPPPLPSCDSLWPPSGPKSDSSVSWAACIIPSTVGGVRNPSTKGSSHDPALMKVLCQ